jgi:hypothetical protein
MEHLFHKYVAIKDSEHFMIKVYAFPECLPYEEISRQQEIGLVNLNCVPEIPDGKNIEKVISENIDFIGSEIHRITEEYYHNKKNILKNSIIKLAFKYYPDDSIQPWRIKNKIEKDMNRTEIKEELFFLEDHILMNEEEWIKQYKQI